jgi:uncharacterized repeat protein (TIGR03803 family)
MKWTRFGRRRFFTTGAAVLAPLALAWVILTPRGAMAAYTEQVLYRFCSQSSCTDGAQPQAGLLLDSSGNLYGTTNGGGQGYGLAFSLSPTTSGWTQKVLGQLGRSAAPLVADSLGNLYGSETYTNVSQGSVFALTPTGNSWSKSFLYYFCYDAQAFSYCLDGKAPNGNLLMDSVGNIYGTTTGGGANSCAASNEQHACGVAYKLTHGNSGWNEAVLYSFCSQSSCSDGENPNGGVITDANGTLFGTALHGGNSTNSGVVYTLSPSIGGWTETVIYTFCSQANCADGASPYAGLIRDGSGNLFGTAKNGGATACTGGCGVVFELSPANPGWTYRAIYTFCSQSNCADGAFPQAGLIMDAAGNLYGTTYNGGTGTNRQGTVFKLAPNTSGWTETVLYNFCSQSSCTDGANPQASLIMDSAGNLYGTTVNGGNSNNAGVVFALGLANATLSLSLNGSGGGKVTSSPAGIDCGSTCSASFPAGTQVTLGASSASAWGFSGWGGACSGIGSCSVTMNANTSVSATFTTLFSVAQAPVVTSPADIPVLPAAILSPLPQPPTAY